MDQFTGLKSQQERSLEVWGNEVNTMDQFIKLKSQNRRDR